MIVQPNGKVGWVELQNARKSAEAGLLGTGRAEHQNVGRQGTTELPPQLRFAGSVAQLKSHLIDGVPRLLALVAQLGKQRISSEQTSR